MRKIIRYQLKYKKGSEEGVYYITYPKKAQALKKMKALKKSFPKVTWIIKKIKRNAWVKEK